MNKVKQLSDLVGHTLQRIDVTEDMMVFVLENGNTCKLYHEQDCCEYVYIEDVVGDVNDLVGVPILKAEEVSNYEGPETIHTRDMDSYKWTFYKFATIKGYVDVRWLGESNGYYSESVDFEGEVYEINNNTAPDNNPVHEAIEFYWGKRCEDFEPTCCVCEAWKQFDDNFKENEE